MLGDSSQRVGRPPTQRHQTPQLHVGKAANSRDSKTKTAVCLSVCLDNGTDQSKFGELITKQPSPGVLLFWFYRYTALNQHQQHATRG